MQFRTNEKGIYNEINTTVVQYPDGYQIKRYKGKLKQRQKGWEEVNKHVQNLEFNEQSKEQKSRIDNINRTRTQVMNLVRCNLSDWKSFVTLTFADDVTDLTQANRHFNNWCRAIRRVFPNFKYLGVPELQKRGVWHYHLFTNLIPGSEFCPVQKGKKKQYDVKYWNKGFSSVFNLDCTDENFRADKYICKYMLKDYERAVLFGRKRVLNSHNLNKPVKWSDDLTDDEYKALKEQLMDKAKSVKEKTVWSANKYCPNFDCVNIITQ